MCICKEVVTFTILLLSIYALVNEVNILMTNWQGKVENQLVYKMNVLCIRNQLNASLDRFVEEF